MYLVENARFYDIDGGTTLEQVAKTGKLYDGRATKLKNFKSLDVESDGPLKFSVWYDGKLVLENLEIEKGGFNSNIPLPDYDARMIELEVKSKETIHSLTVDYVFVGDR